MLLGASSHKVFLAYCNCLQVRVDGHAGCEHVVPQAAVSQELQDAKGVEKSEGQRVME